MIRLPLRVLIALTGTWLSLGAGAQSLIGSLECLDRTGYYFEDGGSGSSVFTWPGTHDSLPLFPRASNATLGAQFDSCQPPVRSSNGGVVPVTKEVSSGGGTATTSLVVGTGISASTAALTQPGRHSAGSSTFTRMGFFANVVSDDPGASSHVDITVQTQYDIGTVRGESTNGGSFGFDLDASQRFVLTRSVSPSQPSVGGLYPGPSGSLVSLANSTVLIERVFTVPVNYPEPLLYEVLFDVASIARGGPGGTTNMPASAAAQAKVSVTHELSVPEGYTVEYPFEAALGLAPPQLGVVAVSPATPAPPPGFFSAIVPLLMDEED